VHERLRAERLRPKEKFKAKSHRLDVEETSLRTKSLEEGRVHQKKPVSGDGRGNKAAQQANSGDLISGRMSLLLGKKKSVTSGSGGTQEILKFHSGQKAPVSREIAERRETGR